MESTGQPDLYGFMRVTQLQSLSSKGEAVCLVNACWEKWTERCPLGQRLNLKDDPRKKSALPMKSVVTLSLRSFLKQDYSVSESEKKTKIST